MNKQLDVRIKRTYAKLITGFLNLLKEKNFDDISVSEICDEAMVHRATFYKHFNDKFEFFNFCLETLLSNIDLTDVMLRPSPENVRASCMEFIKVIFEFIHEYRYVFCAVFSGRQSAAFNSYLTQIITSFCSDKFKGVLVDAPDYRIQILSNFYSGSVIGVAKWYVTHFEECPLEDIYDFFSHRVDEIGDYYEKHFVNDTMNEIV